MPDSPLPTFHKVSNRTAAVSPPPSAATGVGILLCNLGTPDAPTPRAVRRYLAQFLSDPRVVELPALLWKPVLHGIILRTRPRASARKYQQVWTEQGSPLLAYTLRQASLLQERLHTAGHHHVSVAAAMRYGSPGLSEQLDALHQRGIRRVLILPLYPQYSSTTTASVLDALGQWCSQQRDLPDVRWTTGYAENHHYIEALAHSVRSHWQAHGKPQKLVMSYHGIPQRNIHLGDPYQIQCRHTSQQLAQKLGLSPNAWEMTFQSRFGPAQWLQPYTQPTLEEQARNGLHSVDVICPGFASDCLETLEEINMEVREAFLANGGKTFGYIPCLNDQSQWIDALQRIVESQLGGWLE